MHDSVLDTHILNAIQSNQISEQSELQEILFKRGYNVPQATLSRHLKKLKIAKVSGVYKIVDLNKGFTPVLLKVDVSEFGLIVMHTYPGQASSLGYFLDRKYIDIDSSGSKHNCGILGTIAGDDIVLLIVKSKNDIKNIFEVLQEDFPYLKNIINE